MTSGVNVPEGPQGGDSSPTQDSPKPERSPQAEESPQTGDIRRTQESADPSAGERRRGRSGRVVVWLVVAGALLVLAFSPVSRLAADGLPRAPGSFAAVVSGPQHGNTTAIQAVPAGLPNDARIRTAADVLPYAVAALGKQDALALMALLDSKSSTLRLLSPAMAPVIPITPTVSTTPTGTRLLTRCSTKRRPPASLPGRRRWGLRLPCWPRSRRAACRADTPIWPSTTRRQPHTAC